MQDQEQTKTKKRKKRAAFFIVHALVCGIVFSLLFGAALLYYGPFENYRDYVVINVMGTNQDRFLATWFLDQKTISGIMAKANPVVNKNASQDLSGVQVKSTAPPASASAAPSSAQQADAAGNVQIVDVSGKTFHGKMMIVPDPSKVILATAPRLGQSGATLSQIVEANHALGGVNAGGFLDDNLTGNGADPDGVVIMDGQVKFRQSGQDSFSVIGFNRQNQLVISNGMTVDEIQKSNLRCAISFGPALILNGKPLVASGGSALEPRTAIGQRQDGTVLLLAIDGRLPQSPGANYADTMNILQQYGAYNAANLDGGSSTTMNWLGKTISTPCDLNGERFVATAYLVGQ